MKIRFDLTHVIEKLSLFVFFIGFFLYYTRIFPLVVCNFIYLYAAMFWGVHLVTERKNRKTIILYILALVVCGIVSGIHTNDLNFSIYYKSICYLLVGFYFIKIGMGHFLSLLLFWIIEAFLIYSLFVSGIAVNTIFNGLSRNYVSVFSLMVSIIVYFDYEKIMDKPKMFPAIINFIISIAAVGRGGIMASAILLLGVIFIRYFTEVNIHRKIIFLFFSGVFIFVIWFLPNSLDKYMVLFSRFNTIGLSNAGRQMIWNSYLEILKTDLFSIIAGGKVEGIHEIELFGRNLHNTFLQMHYTYGMFFFLIIIYRLVRNGIDFIKNDKALLFLILCVFVVRSSLDQLGYAFFTEVFIYSFVFMKIENFDEMRCNQYA